MSTDIFLDSWDYYDSQDLKYNSGSAQATIDLTNTKARTGIGCLIINSGFQGPLRNLPLLSTVIQGTALYCNILGGAFMTMGNVVPAPDFYFTNVQLNVEANGAITATAWVGSSFTQVATSSAGLVTTNMYNYIEWKVTISDTIGTIQVWLNNILVINASGIRTHSPQTTGGNPTPVSCNAFRYLGAGGAGTWRHDDSYTIYNTATFPTRLGPIRIGAMPPNADSTPLQWTPSTGVTHYTLVDEIPESSVDYVQDGTVGQTDQYLYDNSAIPSPATIFAIQHSLYSALDAAGSGSIGSSVNGVVTGSLALSTSYAMLVQDYATDPADSAAWTVAKVAALKAGPSVTA